MRARVENYIFYLESSGVLHLPVGWWHAVENEETAVTLTLHFWTGDFSEVLAYAPHAALAKLHDIGLFKEFSPIFLILRHHEYHFVCDYYLKRE